MAIIAYLLQSVALDGCVCLFCRKFFVFVFFFVQQLYCTSAHFSVLFAAARCPLLSNSFDLFYNLQLGYTYTTIDVVYTRDGCLPTCFNSLFTMTCQDSQKDFFGRY